MSKRRPPLQGRKRCLLGESLEPRRVLAAALDLKFTTNGFDADAPPGPSIKFGDPVSWTYQVANTGDVPLTKVAVVDDGGTPTNAADDFSPAPVLAAPAGRGTVENTLNLSVSRFLMHPTLPYMYASVPSANSVAVINTQTLQQEALINVGSVSGGMALSADGSRLYVAGSSIGVIDTQSRTVLPSIPIAGYDVEVGADGRLFVLGASYSAIYQINPTTGLSAGPNLPNVFVYGGELAISPNKDRLYYGDYGLSGASLYQFDVTVSPPRLLKDTGNDSNSGSNGQDLAISSDGSFISFACGAGQGGYVIAKYRTSDMSILGTFNTGAYPREITFSPDDAVAYTVHTSGQIDTWDTRTFLSLGTITISGEATELMVDSSGSHVFAAIGSQLRIYSTGRGGDINVGDTNRNRVLDPGETWNYIASGTAQAGQQARTAMATARDASNNIVTDGDLSHYYGTTWQIDVEGTVNGLDADQPSGPTVRAGAALAMNYAVTNPGGFALANVALTDDGGTANDTSDDFRPTLSGGDTDGDGFLDPVETWRYMASPTAKPGSVTHRATVTASAVDAQGQPISGPPATDSDPTSYFGAASSLQVTSTVNGVAANTSPGSRITPGSSVDFTYQVKNTGNNPVNNVSVVDNAGTPGSTGDDFAPTPVLAPRAARGTLEATFDFGVSRFLMDPNRPYMYVSAPSANSVAIINTQTLKQEALIFIGSGPEGMALSLDGTRLYVANGTSNSLGVIDTQSRTALAPITLSQRPHDVEVGADGRLYVLGDSYGSIMQIDPLTGQSAGPNLPNVFVYGGELAISANKDRLYYADYGLSGASLYQFDITVSPPKLLKDTGTDYSSGENGQDLAISSDGSFVSFACGYGQGGYRIAKYRTSDMSILGTFDTGAYPSEITFSPDDKIAYTVHTGGQIDTWDTTTFLSLGTIATSGGAYELMVDSSGSHLFAAFGSQLRVYSTGRAADANSGDTNRNQLLDPGETWSYSARATAVTGPYAASVAATATDALVQPVAAQATTYYVGFVNQPPAATNDAYATNEDLKLIVPVQTGTLSNDSDPDGDSISATLESPPSHGTLTLNTDGSFSYSPFADYNGPDSFSYRASDGGSSSNIATVSITVNPVNDSPVARDDSFSGIQGLPTTVAAPGVLTNDTDTDGDVLSAILRSLPAKGSITLNQDGSFSYTPKPGASGGDSFTYTAIDGSAASADATVTLTISPQNSPPTATGDQATTLEDQPLTLAVAGLLANDTDPDGDPLSMLLVVGGGPSHGTLTIDADGKYLVYVPGHDFNGSDGFTYRASDGLAVSGIATVSLTVSAVNDPPRFTKGADQHITDESGPQQIAGWAGGISVGADNEAGQTLHFIVTSDNVGLFAARPAVDASGTLTFAPLPNVSGTATVLIALVDDGGTLDGGIDVSQPQVFKITVDKLHLLHNAVNPLDVSGDAVIAPNDPMLVINYINTYGIGASAVAEGEATGTPFYDVSADDTVSPIDALLIINYLNAHPLVGQSLLSVGAGSPAGESGASGESLDLLSMLAADLAQQTTSRRQL